MKILQISRFYFPIIGGIQKTVQQISENLNGKENFLIEVLCCNLKRKRKIEEINGVKVWRASSVGIIFGVPLSFDFLKIFKKLIKNVDLIDFHQPFPLGDFAIFLFKPKAKLIIHYHADIIGHEFLEFLIKPLILHTLKKASKILVSNPNLLKNSPYLKKFIAKCKVIPFGVDIEKFKKCFNPKVIKNIKQKYGDFILFAGRLVYYKGLEYLIEAMKFIKINLVIIGEGPLKGKLQSQVSKLKIENKVFFLPFQKEEVLINFYYACLFFVLPSILKSEAFGLALIEAMACGKPIISTELGTGTSFVNQNGITGIIIPPKNIKLLISAIKNLLENKKIIKNFGKNALKRVSEEFSFKKFLQSTKENYQQIT